MTIILTGGGSGGHITPLLAVADEIKHKQPKTKIIYVGQTGDRFADITGAHHNIDELFTVRAGKFRRYHGDGWSQLLDIPTFLKNVRDFCYVIIGIYQSYRLLKRLKPDCIFIKGGFVGVPVGLAAAKLGIPYLTHDSDSIPGLANRIISRWATLHAVAMEKSIYQYPQDKTVTTGIPVQSNFKAVNPELKAKYRQQIDIPKTAKMLFIIGGGLGSQAINKAVSESVPHLLSEFSDLYVVHIVGHKNEKQMEQIYSKVLDDSIKDRLRAMAYTTDVYLYSGAADLIVARAGATNLAEFATQGRAVIVVPSPYLTGGHQLKNAQYLERQGAAEVLTEDDVLDDPNRLAKAVSALLKDGEKRVALGKNLSKFSKPHATEDLADLILKLPGTK